MDSKENTIPLLYKEKEECCGCAACASICPVEAISMKLDEEGFYYPIIDKEKCVGCKVCLSVCGFGSDAS